MPYNYAVMLFSTNNLCQNLRKARSQRATWASLVVDARFAIGAHQVGKVYTIYKPEK